MAIKIDFEKAYGRVRWDFIKVSLKAAVLKQRLRINVEGVKWGLAADSSCPFCGHAPIDILHILRDCTTAKDTTKRHEGRANWSCLFGILAWRLWKNRNFFYISRNILQC
ncbi:hypothetical protein V6Z12_D10G108300 [Gossypium hirsutum]